MNNFEEKLREQSAHIRLTSAKKASMRLAIDEHIRHYPLGAVKSNWLYRASVQRIAASTLAAVLLCAGTASAAQGSLPGDLLYPVKINVTEPAQVALATTRVAKAEVQVQLAEHRVAEAQTLAARGTLTATTTQELQDNFNLHAAEAIALANENGTEPQKTEVATTSASTTPEITVATSTATTTATTTKLLIIAATSAATTTSTSTEAGDRQENFASTIKKSLDTQASILDNLKVQIELRGVKPVNKSRAVSKQKQ